MSDIKNDGGAAFPLPISSSTTYRTNGMTLRDYFAGQAINGFVSTNNRLNESEPLNIAKRAYRIADAMLKARGE